MDGRALRAPRGLDVRVHDEGRVGGVRGVAEGVAQLQREPRRLVDGLWLVVYGLWCMV